MVKIDCKCDSKSFRKLVPCGGDFKNQFFFVLPTVHQNKKERERDLFTGLNGRLLRLLTVKRAIDGASEFERESERDSSKVEKNRCTHDSQNNLYNHHHYRRHLYAGQHNTQFHSNAVFSLSLSLSLSLSSTWCQPEPSPPHMWRPLLLTHPLSLSLAQHCPSYSLIHLNRVSLVRFSLFYYSLQWIRRSGWVSCWELVAKNCSGQEKPLHAKLGRIFVNLFKGASKRWQ